MATRKNGGQIGEVVIEQLRRNVLAGIPWRQPETRDEGLGYGDLIYLDSGHHYAIACDFIHQKDDTETLVAIWSELREDLLREHIKRQPGTRPWAWWREDREQRRVVRIDRNRMASNEGRILESQEDYLRRLGLLTKEEKAATR